MKAPYMQRITMLSGQEREPPDKEIVKTGDPKRVEWFRKITYAWHNFIRKVDHQKAALLVGANRPGREVRH
jgi:hypothetical protein